MRRTITAKHVDDLVRELTHAGWITQNDAYRALVRIYYSTGPLVTDILHKNGIRAAATRDHYIASRI